jgi:AcrR family transcriptional regulator
MVDLTVRKGRPRANPLPGTGRDPRAEILDAAARLFTALGYSAASTRQIADAVGLRQASIFHYFPRKEDMLTELLNRTVEPSLDFAGRLAKVDAPPCVALYLLLVNDLSTYSQGPGNIGSLQVQPDARAEQFAGYWVKRDLLRSMYRDVIARGSSTGSFDVSDVELQTDIVFGLVESVSTWFEQGGPREPQAVFDAIATFAVKAVVADPSCVQSVMAQAQVFARQLS